MRVLVTNDDGIHAPGLRSLVAALAAAGLPPCVAAPASERSAAGHGITITGPLTAVPLDVPGAAEAYSIDGSPADSTMLALSDAGLFADSSPFDVVLSGVNRGNNFGLHVLYSGTVAGAREAAAKGVCALALSLDHHSKEADYSASVAVTLPLVLRLQACPELRMAGCVLNVNVPRGALGDIKGYALTEQSYECTRPGFKPVVLPACWAAPAGARAWMNSASGGVALDRRPGTDALAVAEGYVSITVITLLSHAPPVPTAQPHRLELEILPLGFTAEAADAVLRNARIAAIAAGVGDAMRHNRLAEAPAEEAQAAA